MEFSKQQTEDGPDEGGPTFAGRVLALVRKGILAHRGQCLRLIAVGFVATGVEAWALLLVIPIVRKVGKSGGVETLGVSVKSLDFSEYLLYVLGIAVLFTLAVRLKYVVFSIAYRLAERFTVDCGVSAMTALHARLRSESLPARTVRRVVSRSLFGAASACGILFRHVLLALHDGVLLFVFAVVLLYLSPLVTLVLGVLAVPPVALYVRSYRKIAAEADRIVEHKQESRNETLALVNAVGGEAQSPEEVERLVRGMFETGRAGRALSGKASMRRRMRGSGAFVELLTPISVVVIAVVIFFAPALGLDLATVLAYYLILRRTVSAANQVAHGLITVNRVYPGIRDYLAVVDRSRPLPESWTGDSRTVEFDDSEEDD